VERVVVVGGGVLGTMSAGNRVPAARVTDRGHGRGRTGTAYDHLRGRAERLLGSPLPPTGRRWAGVYSQATGPELYHKSQIAPGVVLVTGPGGRGMTLAPAIAEELLP